MTVGFEDGYVAENGLFDDIVIIDTKSKKHGRIIGLEKLAQRYVKGPEDILITLDVETLHTVREGACCFSYYCRELGVIHSTQIFKLYEYGGQTPLCDELVIRRSRWDRKSDIERIDKELMFYPTCVSDTEYIFGEPATELFRKCVQTGDEFNKQITYTRGNDTIIEASILAVDSLGNFHQLKYSADTRPLLYESFVQGILKSVEQIPADSKKARYNITLLY